MIAFLLGVEVVRFMDEQGAPAYYTFEYLAHIENPPALLGIVAEAARRDFSNKRTLEIVETWLQFYKPTALEALAIVHLRSQEK